MEDIWQTFVYRDLTKFLFLLNHINILGTKCRKEEAVVYKCGNYAFPQNLHNKKLGEITVFDAGHEVFHVEQWALQKQQL